MSWTLGTEANAIKTAGAGASSIITADSTTLALWADQAEGRIQHQTKRSWVADFAGLGEPIKGLLQDVFVAMVAKKIVKYDSTNYFNSREYETILDILDETVDDGLRLIEDFVKSGSLKSP